MAISYQQVASPVDGGEQGMFQLASMLQQQSQFDEQLAAAKGQFDEQQAAKAQEIAQAQSQFETNLQMTLLDKQQKDATTRFEMLKGFDYDIVRNDPNMSALATQSAQVLGLSADDDLDSVASHWNLTKDQKIAAEGRLLERQKFGLEQAEVGIKQGQLALNQADTISTIDKRSEDIRIDEEQLDLGWAKLGFDPRKNPNVDLQEAARHKGMMDGYIEEIKTLTSELDEDGKEKSKGEYKKDVAKAEFKRNAYNKLATTYGSDKLAEPTATGADVNKFGFWGDYDIQSIDFEGKITPYTGKAETETPEEEQPAYTANGESYTQAQYDAINSAQLAGDSHAKKLFFSMVPLNN